MFAKRLPCHLTQCNTKLFLRWADAQLTMNLFPYLMNFVCHLCGCSCFEIYSAEIEFYCINIRKLRETRIDFIGKAIEDIKQIFFCLSANMRVSAKNAQCTCTCFQQKHWQHLPTVSQQCGWQYLLWESCETLATTPKEGRWPHSTATMALVERLVGPI